jgi:hypothetical protein
MASSTHPPPPPLTGPSQSPQTHLQVYSVKNPVNFGPRLRANGSKTRRTAHSIRQNQRKAGLSAFSRAKHTAIFLSCPPIFFVLHLLTCKSQ